MTRVALLLALFLAAPLLAQEDEIVIIPRSEVRELIQELKRLRTEVQKANDLLQGCRA